MDNAPVVGRYAAATAATVGVAVSSPAAPTAPAAYSRTVRVADDGLTFDCWWLAGKPL